MGFFSSGDISLIGYTTVEKTGEMLARKKKGII